MKTVAWQTAEYTPTQLEDWLLAVDREEAAWVANVGPAFVTYATAMAQAAATETIARAAASGAQSLADLQSDHAYQSAVDALMHQAQRDQQDAWYDYLDDWYAAEQLDAIQQNAAQAAFDAAAGAAAMLRAAAFETADRDSAAAFLLTNSSWPDATVPNWLGRTAAEIPYVTAYGAADVTWSTATANSARDRKSDQADFQHDYEERLADIDRDLAVSIAPLEKTRQVAYGAHQRTAWSAEVTAANARRSSEYLAIANYRTADYSSRAIAVGNLATDFALPWVDTQSHIAAARVGWWINDAQPEFLTLGANKNASDTAYQTAINTAYSNRVDTTSDAAKTYTIAQANVDYSERAGNATGLQGYLKSQADAERNYYVDHAAIRRDEFLRVANLFAAAGTYPTGVTVFNPDTPPQGTLRPELTTAANRVYGQQVVPADGARRIGVMDRRFVGINENKSAEAEYLEAVQLANATQIEAMGNARGAQILATTQAGAEYGIAAAESWSETLVEMTYEHPSPWASLEAAKSVAEAGYFAAIAPAMQTVVAAANVDATAYDLALLAIDAANERASLATTWRQANQSAENSFVDSRYTTQTPYRKQVRQTLATTTQSTLSELRGENSTQPTAQQTADFDAAPPATFAGSAHNARNTPAQNKPSSLGGDYRFHLLKDPVGGPRATAPGASEVESANFPMRARGTNVLDPGDNAGINRLPQREPFEYSYEEDEPITIKSATLVTTVFTDVPVGSVESQGVLRKVSPELMREAINSGHAVEKTLNWGESRIRREMERALEPPEQSQFVFEFKMSELSEKQIRAIHEDVVIPDRDSLVYDAGEFWARLKWDREYKDQIALIRVDLPGGQQKALIYRYIPEHTRFVNGFIAAESESEVVPAAWVLVSERTVSRRISDRILLDMQLGNREAEFLESTASGIEFALYLLPGVDVALDLNKGDYHSAAVSLALGFTGVGDEVFNGIRGLGRAMKLLDNGAKTSVAVYAGGSAINVAMEGDSTRAAAMGTNAAVTGVPAVLQILGVAKSVRFKDDVDLPPSLKLNKIDDAVTRKVQLSLSNGEAILAPISNALPEQPLLLTYQPTSRTLAQVRSLPQPAKWQAGEQYVQELYGSPGQRHLPVPSGNGIKGAGGRFVDAPLDLPNGGILAGEVKTYGQWRTVNGLPQQQTIQLTDQIRQQVLKDVWLRNNVPNYDPRWIFLDAPPSAELLEFFRQYRIISVTHGR